ncbi:MAG: hypothetical protein ABL982_10715 [Vicinamibacterales bacterium]
MPWSRLRTNMLAPHCPHRASPVSRYFDSSYRGRLTPAPLFAAWYACLDAVARSWTACQSGSGTMRNSGASMRMTSLSARCDCALTPQAFRLRVRFQTISPRYSGRRRASHTDEGAQPFGRPCCARGQSRPASLSRFAIERTPSPKTYSSNISRTTAACASSIWRSTCERTPAASVRSMFT